MAFHPNEHEYQPYADTRRYGNGHWIPARHFSEASTISLTNSDIDDTLQFSFDYVYTDPKLSKPEAYESALHSTFNEDVVPLGHSRVPDAFCWSHPWGYPVASPCHSGYLSSYPSSRFDGSESPPWCSPQTFDQTYPPALYADNISSDMDCYIPVKEPHFGGGYSCVAPHDVQHSADSHLDAMTVEDETPVGDLLYMSYAPDAQEGYVPMVSDSSTHGDRHTPALTEDAPSPKVGAHGNGSPNLRRRRTQPPRSRPALNPSKVVKRYPTGTKKLPSATTTIEDPVDRARPFLCTFAIYGCKSSFGSKNEWKRHVNTQHMRLGYWRCDQCDQHDRLPNDFNRKDLFISHMRRMHPVHTPKSAKYSRHGQKSDLDEQAMTNAANRCYKPLHAAPEKTACFFCDEKFHGHRTWDDRMEHIGRHMEGMKKDTERFVALEDWRPDEGMERWLETEGLILEDGDDWVLAEEGSVKSERAPHTRRRCVKSTRTFE